MAIPDTLISLLGSWQGINRLWFSPDDPARESAATAEVALVAGGKFATVHYTWAYENQPQDGLLLLGQEPQSNLVTAVWVDSWHVGDKAMQCQGGVRPDETVWVQGAYAAPPGPDWGWQIIIEPEKDGRFRFAMDNISPEGEEMLAVEVLYQRER